MLMLPFTGLLELSGNMVSPVLLCVLLNRNIAFSFPVCTVKPQACFQNRTQQQSLCLWCNSLKAVFSIMYIHIIYTHLTALFPGLPGWAGTRKVKPIWILLKQETMSGSGISWAMYKSAPRSRQITTPAPHHLVFYRPDALPAAQPTVSKH